MAEQSKEGSVTRELPAAFMEEMKELFATLPGVSVAELPAFFESLRGERSYGLRRNSLKYTKEEFEEKMPFSLQEIPWAAEGYFYQNAEQPGKSVYHEAGAFYVQEPSAMIAAELLGAKPGEYIADLCAAPGGKSTQIAGKLQGEGLLVCNEYVPARAEILAQNMERMGVCNCVILKESVDRAAMRFPLFFDRVLVDAPCSGEGMFRKEEQALLQWSPENVRMCAARQKEILEEAAKTVKPGGVLVYSTCTFSEAEDEAVIREFLERHKEFYADETVLSDELAAAGVCPGGMPGTVRMWPHKLRGEGHFAAKLVKGKIEGIKKAGAGADAIKEDDLRDENNINICIKKNLIKSLNTNECLNIIEKLNINESSTVTENSNVSKKSYRKEKRRERYNENPKKAEKGSEQENRKLFQAFCGQYLHQTYLKKLQNSGKLVWKKEHLFLVSEELPDLGGLWVERGGLHLGEAKKGRFVPSHTWAMTLKKEDVLQCVEAENAAAYLRGETLKNAGYKGWILILLQGKALGWGKAVGNMVKNHYPKGLRSK